MSETNNPTDRLREIRDAQCGTKNTFLQTFDLEDVTAIQSATADMVIDKNNPWPLYDVLGKLVEAAEILLHEKDYDGHAWEEIATCITRGKELQANILSIRNELTGEGE